MVNVMAIGNSIGVMVILVLKEDISMVNALAVGNGILMAVSIIKFIIYE
jgi:hypothetical protein